MYEEVAVLDAHHDDWQRMETERRESFKRKDVVG